MLPVAFAVGDIVQNIYEARDEAEGAKRTQTDKEEFGIKKMLRKDERRKDEKVFRPLLGSDQAEKRQGNWLLVGLKRRLCAKCCDSTFRMSSRAQREICTA